MNLWTTLVAALERLVVAAGDALGGSLALGILAVTLGLRLALIPIMLPLAARTRDRQRVVDGFKPEFQELKRQFAKDPDRLQKEINALHARHGIKVFDGPGLLGALIQLPVLIAMFTAVLHLSEGTALSANGLLWGIAAAVVSTLTTALSGTRARSLLALSAVLPIAIALWLGQGIAMYLLAFYAGSFVQGLLLRRVPVRTGTVTAAAGR
ncbi:MAG: YidC/Oxa1 family membrane protein insertase [Gemmatimonadetes bacterium]|nr:YidC/Oxa1 family membrane protein insertase [Gemmatimonadota bacterium]